MFFTFPLTRGRKIPRVLVSRSTGKGDCGVRVQLQTADWPKLRRGRSTFLVGFHRF